MGNVYGGVAGLRFTLPALFTEPTLKPVFRLLDPGPDGTAKVEPAGDKHEVVWLDAAGTKHHSSQVVGGNFNCCSLGDTLVLQGEAFEKVVDDYQGLEIMGLQATYADSMANASLWYEVDGEALAELSNDRLVKVRVNSGIDAGPHSGTQADINDYHTECTNLMVSYGAVAATTRTRRSGKDFGSLAVSRVAQMGDMIDAVVANRRAMAEWQEIPVERFEVRDLLSDCYMAAVNRKVSEPLSDGKVNRLIEVYNDEQGAHPGSLFGIYQGVSWMLARKGNGGVLNNPNNRMLKPLNQRDSAAHARAAACCQRYADSLK